MASVSGFTTTFVYPFLKPSMIQRMINTIPHQRRKERKKNISVSSRYHSRKYVLGFNNPVITIENKIPASQMINFHFRLSLLYNFIIVVYRSAKKCSKLRKEFYIFKSNYDYLSAGKKFQHIARYRAIHISSILNTKHLELYGIRFSENFILKM